MAFTVPDTFLSGPKEWTIATAGAIAGLTAISGILGQTVADRYRVGAVVVTAVAGGIALYAVSTVKESGAKSDAKKILMTGVGLGAALGVVETLLSQSA